MHRITLLSFLTVREIDTYRPQGSLAYTVIQLSLASSLEQLIGLQTRLFILLNSVKQLESSYFYRRDDQSKLETAFNYDLRVHYYMSADHIESRSGEDIQY